MLKEFKNFAMRGNVVDMAIGVIIGGAFGKIVNSVVSDIIMPPLGKILGQVNFRDLFINLSDQTFTSLAEAQKAGAPVLAYGNFFQTIVDFVIISFSIFLMIKFMERLRKKDAAAPEVPKGPTDIEVLLEIRDLLKK